MKIERQFTTAGQDAYADLDFVTTSSEIRNPDGTTVFRLDEVEVPASWSQVASDVIAQKYFRKAGVPNKLEEGARGGRAEFLWRSVPAAKNVTTGGETSARQVFDRLAGAWAYWGWKGGYFHHRRRRARLFRRDARHARAPDGRAQQPAMVQHRPALGLRHRRAGAGALLRRSRHRQADPLQIRLRAPAAACLLHPVGRDDLVGDGGIMDLWVREARLFKYGSGTGTNFSSLRAEGEKLSGGGKSSGLMGFLKIGDRAAGAIKSGGTTRRAAKMVICDADHPDIEEFINWKVIEEQKVASIVAGSKMHEAKLNDIFAAIRAWDGSTEDAVDPKINAGPEGGHPRRQAGADPRNLRQARARLRQAGL